MTEESSHEPSPSGEAGRPEKPTPSATQYAQLSFQLSKSVLGFQSTFAEIAKQRHAHISALLTPQLSKSVLGFQSTFAEIAKQRNAHISALLTPQLSKSVLGFQSTFAEIAKQRNAHISALLTPQLSKSVLGFQSSIAEIAKQHSTALNLGLGTALTDAIKATSLQRSRTVLQFADLAKTTSAFTAGLSALYAQEDLTSKSVLSSALKLSRMYENHPAFRSMPSQAAVVTVSTVEADLIDANARDLAEDGAQGLDVAELADALLKQIRKAEEEPGRSGRSFHAGNVAPGALFLGVLVLLYSAASDVAGMVNPELAGLLDRQFTYASLAMATLYFLYQEGKR